jgi:GTP pyrophosphokinase
MGFLELDDLDDILGKKSPNKLVKYWNITFGRKNKEKNTESSKKPNEKQNGKKIDKQKPFLLKEEQDNISYSLAKCCNPIPGDEVIGYLSTDEHVIIHKRGCKEVEKFLSSHGDQIVTAEWTRFKKQSYLTRLRLEGFDRVGILNEVTNVISKQHSINMRSVQIDTNEGVFKGDLFIYIHNAGDLKELISELKNIRGIDRVSRIENLND